jgi:hypothetical protein
MSELGVRERVEEISAQYPEVWAEIHSILSELEKLGISGYRLNATDEEPVQLFLQIAEA